MNALSSSQDAGVVRIGAEPPDPAIRLGNDIGTIARRLVSNRPNAGVARARPSEPPGGLPERAYRDSSINSCSFAFSGHSASRHTGQQRWSLRVVGFVDRLGGTDAADATRLRNSPARHAVQRHAHGRRAAIRLAGGPAGGAAMPNRHAAL